MTRRLSRLLALGIATVAATLYIILPVQAAPSRPPPNEDTHWNNIACNPIGPDGRFRRPVVLLHGLFANGEKNGVWAPMARFLIKRHFCVFSLTYGAKVDIAGGVAQVKGGDSGLAGLGGLDDIEKSVREVKLFVERTSRLMGGYKMDIVAHSEGTVVTRGSLKALSAASVVDRVVLISPVGRGTTLNGLLPTLRRLGLIPLGEMAVKMTGLKSLYQMAEGSEYLKSLGESLPDVQYLQILTRCDEVITPPENGLLKNSQGQIVTSSPPPSPPSCSCLPCSLPSSLLSTLSPSSSVSSGAGAGKAGDASSSNVLNQWLQDWCPCDRSGHMELLKSRVVFAGVLQFLDPEARVEILCR
ncbi:hypothetical protein DFQ27_002885 [Actinomortierella ambigua]|uniref:Triacylglycerol lipase n=1 Tax=Actinomortierella ambigua TaxID=1343610 RepID=A0A9P6QAA4_9FUNG|nr:hypothetical protein DFQ27_002885 [Actinomortierella ambigua]